MSILKETKKVVIINAGHWSNDSGATYHEYVESQECQKIRNEVVPMLRDRGYEVHSVPDHLNLKRSIAWANDKAPELNDALAVDIHLNFLSNTDARGSEAFYGKSETSKNIASALTTNVSQKLGIPNRGAKPDTETAVGSLGWIRNTTMWASLIEVCFMTNKQDVKALTAPGGYRLAAKGIADGIDEIFGIETAVVSSEKSLADYSITELFEELKRRISLFS